MDYSLRSSSSSQDVRMKSLNPYSNGLLSESLTESVLRFPHFFILQKSLLFLRELVQLE